MAHVRGTKNKIKPRTWATFNKPFPKKKKNEQNKTYKKRRNWNAGLAKKKEEEGEEAKKKKKKKKKGVKANEDGDNSASNPLVFSLLSKIFFFSPADFLLPAKTHRYSADTIRFGPNRRESAHVGAYRETTTKKNWTWFDAQAAASLTCRRLGHGCGGQFAASMHPSYNVKYIYMNSVM